MIVGMIDEQKLIDSGIDLLPLIIAEVGIGVALLGLLGSGENRIRLNAGFENLPRFEIRLRVLNRLQDALLDLFIGEAVGGLHLDGLLPASARVTGGDVQDAISI